MYRCRSAGAIRRSLSGDDHCREDDIPKSVSALDVVLECSPFLIMSTKKQRIRWVMLHEQGVGTFLGTLK